MASEMAQKPVVSSLPSETPTPVVMMRSPANSPKEKPIRPLQPIQITPESQVPFGNQTFQVEVTEAGLSLSVLSSVIYGTVKRSQEIAEWNHLESLDHILLGQILILKNVSPIAQTDLNKRILPLWREKLSKRNEMRRSLASEKPKAR
jgi:hypothetical protein